jgi:NTP pyrophosphatase (non-canonical NTP hydrolase)
MDNFNGLTPAEDERLALLLEEMGEALQAIGKIKRHGYQSYHPNIPERCNREDLEKELGHVGLAIMMMVEAGDVSQNSIKIAHIQKRQEIGQYLHHQD